MPHASRPDTLIPMKPFDLPPDLVLLDLDDTLCDYASARSLRLRLAFDRALGYLPKRPEIDLDQLVAESIAIHPHGIDHFHELLARYDAATPEGVASAQQWYRTNRFHGLKLFEDAVETLLALRSASPARRIGMITNGPTETQHAKIDLLGIRAHFDFIIVSEEFGVPKPEAAIFEEALRLGRAEPDRSVFIGDSPEHDIAGAHNAGIRSVWMNRSGRRWAGPIREPAFSVDSLTAVAPLLFGTQAGRGTTELIP